MKEGVSEDIECVFESVGARGSIYISNYPAAQNAALLQAMNIKAVLSVARSGLLSHRKEDVPLYLYIPMEDHEEYDISKYFETTYDFIERGRRESNVLIHCMVGVSRSVTIVIAYLLRKYKYTLSQVISLIQRKRRKINPNPGFLEQLQKYSESLGIKCDFYQKRVPALREISTSKQVRAHSLKKERTSLQVPQPLTPMPFIEKQKEKTVLNPITCNQDLKNFGLKLQVMDLKKMKSMEERTTNDPEDFPPRRPFNNINEHLDLKKSISIDQSKTRKRSSIEEKISKIRERILKTEHFEDAKPALQAKPKPKHDTYSTKKEESFSFKEFSVRQNDLSNKHLQMLTPTKPQEISQRRGRIELSNHLDKESTQFRNYLREEKNRELFSSDLKIQSKAFYAGHRQNPRFIRSKEQMAL